MNIPHSISEVTADWLSEALGAKVDHFQLEQIGQGVGIMGDIYRVTLDYGADVATAPASAVVKLPSAYPENREQGVALGMFDAEVRFYRELADQVTSGLPQIYHADIRSGTAEFVIVMEDLASLEMVDQVAGMQPAQAEAAVRVLAGVHATWWNRVQDGGLDWIPSMVSDRIAHVDQLFTQIFPTFAEKFESYLPPGGIDVYEGFTGRYLAINTVIAGRSPWTLVHQDFRVENMLFDTNDPDRVVVIDWQGIGRGPGAYDLAYLLGGSMDTALRRQHELHLVGAYHDALMDAGVTGYSLEQLSEDYAHAHLMGGLATSMITGGAMDLSNERGVNLISTMASRHAAAALDHGGLERLRAFA